MLVFFFYLKFAEFGWILLEIGVVDLGERVDILVAALARHRSIVQRQELVEEAILDEQILRDLIVGHRLAELVDALQYELAYLADRFHLEFVEEFVDVAETLDLGWRLLVQIVYLVIELVKALQEGSIGQLTVG